MMTKRNRWIPRTVCVLAMTLASSVLATDFTWDGSQPSQNWDALSPFPLDTNWDPNSSSFPAALDTVTFPSSASAHMVNLHGDREVISVTITGGSGYLIGGDSTQYALTLGSGAITASGAGTHRFGANADIVLGAKGIWKVVGTTTLEIDSNISGGFALNKTDTGTLTLKGANTYTGGTTVSAGTLQVTSSSATGTGLVNIKSGAEISGSGSVSGALTVASGATVTPGTSGMDTLTADGAVTLFGTYQCEIDGTAADQLAVGGTLNISSGTLNIDLLNGGATEDVYVIATYGTLTGSSPFATVTGLPAGYKIDYAYNGNQIALVELSPYESWTSSYGLSGTNALFDADSDGDGGLNGYEWATGTNPTNATSLALLGIGSTNSSAIVSFTRNTNATDVIIELQRSLDLTTNLWSGVATNTAGSWSPSGIVSESGSDNPLDVEISDPQTNHPAASYRLLVE